MYKDNQLYVAHSSEGPIHIIGKMANRHGLIAGATGTGKTVTLQVLAETFSQAGVPCFMADMKGDLSGISQTGGLSKFIEKRCAEWGMDTTTLKFEGCPVRFYDVFGEQGHPMRTTIEKMTPAYPSSITTKEAAIDYIYNDKIARELDIILYYWATGNTLMTEFTAKAKEVILHENVSGDGSLAVPSIAGIESLGHTDADYETAMASTNVGVRHATHLFNAMSPLAHRNPGVVGAALNSDVTVELIVDTFHVNPALYNMIYKLKGDKLCFITDCLPAGGLPEGEYTLGGQKFVSKGIECRLPDGTIAGSILALNKGVWNVYTNSDIPLYECVNCASLNPANAIGIGDKKGSLEVGKDADIIITDCEFNVEKTIIGGTVRYGA